MSTVFKVVYLHKDSGEYGRLPDLGIINAGGTDGPTFTVGGRGLLFADGTSTAGDGAGSILQLTLQGVYNNSAPANIDLSAGKNFTITALNGNKFTVNAETGDVTLDGDLNVLGSATVIDSTIQNVDSIEIGPTTNTQVGLSIEPLAGVVSSVNLIEAKGVNGGPVVFSVSPTGLIDGVDLVALKATVDSHLDGIGAKHTAANIGVAGSYSNISGSNVEEVITSIDAKLTQAAAAIQTYEHLQPVASMVWTCLHAHNSRRPTVSVYDAEDVLIFADEVRILDENTVQVTFNTPQDGRALLITF